MNALERFMVALPETKTIRDRLPKLDRQLVTGLTTSAKALVLAGLAKETSRRLVVVTHNMYQAQKMYDQLEALIGPDKALLYPIDETLAGELSLTSSPELLAARIEARTRLLHEQGGVVVVPLGGLRRFIPSPDDWQASHHVIRPGQELELKPFAERLVTLGYERTATVTAPGEFSVRGSILDVYPLTEARPFRIDLFDTEVDSVFTFDAETQRSLGVAKEAVIPPATEFVASADQLKKAGDALNRQYERTLSLIETETIRQALEDGIAGDIETLRRGDVPSQIGKFTPLLYKATLLDYVGAEAVLILDEVARIEDAADVQDREEAEWFSSLIERGESVSNYTLAVPMHKVFRDLKQVAFSLLPSRRSGIPEANTVHLSCRPLPAFHGQMHLLKQEVERWQQSDHRIVFLAGDKDRADKVATLLEDYGIPSTFTNVDGELLPRHAHVMIGQIEGGFELSTSRLVVVSEEELFKRVAKRKRQTKNLTNAERIKSYQELKPNDHVVHIHHGIGKYLGIKTIEVGGIHQDYLHLVYAGDDALYVPVDQIDLVQKYVGAEGKEPKIYKLGGTEWKKVKSKVAKSVEDIADELIKLYAAREASVGYAFPGDDEEMSQFESSFPYAETEDQVRSIAEIKADMERSRPMDRLLCGDVGYGKTEVAIRAAFKAVLAGKQVAFLVPTTVLAQQHYETMLERFSEFPINVSVMSRFRSKSEMAATKKGLKEGTIDVVVGTHRVLSKDVTFADLGLVIIDEEQRFGVKHKERLKQLKTNIDVLTLTATPIPRTLHMSMIGIRDLSVLETPPENRYPVQTYVMEYDGIVLREALERELARGGQAFFLYNRVEGIERKAEEIRALLPEARIATAHGRMTETELESQLISFLEGEADILVSTTIIETGIDIPNVNTLIVHDADKMGLSQLYQLRGRVGRSNRIAYAYFTYRKDKRLTEVAESRLQAIKEFTELGSGFKIAMRDLSIRGAGNLLGAQQSGFIDSVGFDLYSQMLSEAIEERKDRMRGQAKQVVFKPEISFQADAYIPDDYLSDSELKIEMYKRFKYVDTPEALFALQDELIERFGEFPEPVALLIQLTRLRIYGEMARVARIKQVPGRVEIVLTMESTTALDVPSFMEWTMPLGRKLGVGQDNGALKLSLSGRMPVVELLNDADTVLEELTKRLAHAAVK
ncbi:transcription-repair coupling factor [Exiguobacterium alkaliphilum]|uniref:transcription-repair coupling factor n=1 Tax=Exiguobacterium alkaliphilum TaxID=1428684 RepID=UPI001BA784F8|nr:transcription-repair coupling factor [Exiguobacterium alkaliphilum]QUE86723.1 transcription-repair coupling factor [Exiguobacterium alkaliphilum]